MKKFVIFIENFFCIFRERRNNNQYAGRQVPSQAPLPSLPPSQGQSEPPYTKCLCKSQMKSEVLSLLCNTFVSQCFYVSVF